MKSTVKAKRDSFQSAMNSSRNSNSRGELFIYAWESLILIIRITKCVQMPNAADERKKGENPDDISRSTRQEIKLLHNNSVCGKRDNESAI